MSDRRMYSFFILPLMAATLLAAAGCTSTGEIPDMKTAQQAQKAGDYDRARAHYQALAEKGYPQAKVALAKLSMDRGMPLTSEERQLIEDSMNAKANSPQSFEDLAELALAQKPAQYGKALEYYQQAYDSGSVKAASKIGDIYADTKQGQKAVEWYKTAIAHGDSKSVYRLGRVYERGIMGKRDFATALSYYKRAQELGVDGAAKGVDRMNKKLSQPPKKKAVKKEITEKVTEKVTEQAPEIEAAPKSDVVDSD